MESSFRAELAAWCREHVPVGWRDELRGSSREAYVSFQHRWQQVLVDAGYYAPHWPAAFGGSDWGLAEQVVLYEELNRADAPRLALWQVALYNAAPAILHHGTPEQAKRYLAGMIKGEVWCQGFSEPNAGSDLASLSTRAIRDGDRFVVNGQKLWTSWALDADWCILLARTDPAAAKHRGISYFLMDMHSPGVDVRPIKQATGATEFNEIFLTDVVIPEDNLLGPENGGWAVAQGTLSSERAVVVVDLAERLRRNGLDSLIESAQDWYLEDGSRALDDVGVREALAEKHAEIRALQLLVRRFVDRLIRGDAVGADSPIVKVFYSELQQSLTELGVAVAGLPAHLDGPLLMAAGCETGNLLIDYVASFAWTIGGGTSEILRNIIGEQALALPR